jgi:hypothetical protein
VRWAWIVARIGEAFTQDLIGNSEGSKLIRRPKYNWKDNIKMDLREILRDMGCIHAAQDRDQWL